MNRTRLKIIENLTHNSDRYLSGAYFSKLLGISRAAVWKHVRTLRSKGYQINAKPNCGYKLESGPELIQKELFDGLEIYYDSTVDSTNLRCRALAENNAVEYSTVIAEKQLQGRGRLGRSWFSPPESGLWFSILLRPHNYSPADVSAITLVTAATTAEFLNCCYNLPVKVKWPNDLLINGKKTGGILTEIKAEPDWIEYLIVGIGLNVNQNQPDFPGELQDQATSLAIAGGNHFDRTLLFIKLRRELIKAYQLFFKEGFKYFQELWKKHNLTLGKNVKVNWPGGSLQGFAYDLNQEGALLLKDEREKFYSINFGEIIDEI